ncbi:nucleoside-diphosphate-sugar epimerase [Rhizobium leguminosarum]|nr:NmrA family NAD(P)-binding protein [Rhizobium leguminosarum]MBB5661838.1 nucleoside-diphosphate-sugar epimerase [Rhizobium leguminosarum]
MRIAVVGATGRIGARLTENLLAGGHSVKALSRGLASIHLSRKELSRSLAASTQVLASLTRFSKTLTLHS